MNILKAIKSTINQLACTKFILLFCLNPITDLLSQNQYFIDFSGTEVNPEEVRVDNLTQGIGLSLNGADTLYLKVMSVGISNTELTKNILSIYPNPSNGLCNINLVNALSGSVTFSLFSLSGKLHYEFTNKLAKGAHSYQISGLPEGLYILKVATPTDVFTRKIISNNKNETSFKFESLSYQKKNIKQAYDNSKNNKSLHNMDFTTGDQLRFIGMATGYDNDTVYASPTSSQTIDFYFASEVINPFQCGVSTVTFDYNGNQVAYGTVEGQNGTCWLDRNLGASQVCNSTDDANCLGDLFQWGRYADGHQIRVPLSDFITTLSPSDNPGHNKYIRDGSYTRDWRATRNDSLWRGVEGINNPCPAGWRLPTIDELDAERLVWTSNNSTGAFSSVLKLPIAGRRVNNGNVDWTTTNGTYWSSTPDMINPDERKSRALWINNLPPSGNAGIMSYDRQNGVSVRCIKN